MNDPADDVLDEQLRRAFTPPPPAAIEGAVRTALAPAPLRPRTRRWPWLAAACAAAAAACALAFWLTRPARGPEGHDGAQLGAMWVAVYEHAVASLPAGGSCCDPHSDFGAMCQQRFAVRVAAGNGVTLRGCYCGLPTGGCIAVLADHADDVVAVFALPRAHDPSPTLPAGCRWHLSRRELGDVVLYGLCRGSAVQALQDFVITP